MKLQGKNLEAPYFHPEGRVNLIMIFNPFCHLQFLYQLGGLSILKKFSKIFYSYFTVVIIVCFHTKLQNSI